MSTHKASTALLLRLKTETCFRSQVVNLSARRCTNETDGWILWPEPARAPSGSISMVTPVVHLAGRLYWDLNPYFILAFLLMRLLTSFLHDRAPKPANTPEVTLLSSTLGYDRGLKAAVCVCVCFLLLPHLHSTVLHLQF